MNYWTIRQSAVPLADDRLSAIKMVLLTKEPLTEWSQYFNFRPDPCKLRPQFKPNQSYVNDARVRDDADVDAFDAGDVTSLTTSKVTTSATSDDDD